MSTTLTALLSDGQRVGLVHVGDSRAYRWRAGCLTRLTSDHTLVQSLVDDGYLTSEQAVAYPHRSVVTRALNGEIAADPDLGWVEVEVGDRLLVCSDGLTDLVDDDRIAEVLAGPPDGPAGVAPGLRDGERGDLDWIVDGLVEGALRAGGRDNVTCILGEVIDGPEIRPFGRALGAFFPTNLIDGAAIRMVRTDGRCGVRLESVSAQ